MNHGQRQTALDTWHTAQNAMNEAQSEWYLASGKAIMPEREVRLQCSVASACLALVNGLTERGKPTTFRDALE